MQRRAINPSGRLGSLYDGSRDRIMGSNDVKLQERSHAGPSTAECEIINGDGMTTSDILRRIGLEDELLLSLLLNTTKRTGIAKVLNYTQEINKHTRVFFYSWLHSVKQQSTKKAATRTMLSRLRSHGTATHVITDVSFGIDLLLILQLPSNIDLIKRIDRALDELKRQLRQDQSTVGHLSPDQTTVFQSILAVEVYSNIPELNSKTDIGAVLREIARVRKDCKRCRPLRYTLEPISSFDSLTAVPSQLIALIKQHLLSIRNQMKDLEASLNGETSDLLCGHLATHLKEAHKRRAEFGKRYLSAMKPFAKCVIDVRRGSGKDSKIRDAVCDLGRMQLLSEIHALRHHRDELKTKGHFITNLRQHQFDYLNAADHKLNDSHRLRDIEHKLQRKGERHCILCSSDTLNNSHPQKLIELRHLIAEHQKRNPELRLIYLDFTYTRFLLREMVILPSGSIDLNQKYPAPAPPSPIDDSKSPSIPQPESPSSEDEVINILLLGETGTGKSTFINAFANYLAFSSFQQAHDGEPTVLIPVSFIHTSGHHFDEQTITFGECDSSNNEHFNKHGQSVTQQCRSYDFDLPQHQGRRVCIIDTPGFGDTRGIDQDDRNIDHILRYITQWTHLHAVCFLLKPNESRLSISFRRCLNQLFSLLGPKVGANVLFCFTNARSTFYAPGNTAPLLKKMLTAVEGSRVEMKKENTFCFDSESFRYLMAVENGVTFREEEKGEYEKSWITSVKESDRLLDHIQNQLSVFHMADELQSVKHAQLKISDMIRPILETMRNLLRNMILCKINHRGRFIQMKPEPLNSRAIQCHSCQSNDQFLEQFWIRSYERHGVEDECTSCKCPIDQHSPIDYALQYDSGNDCVSGGEQQMQDTLTELYRASAKFSCFLERTAYAPKKDPFLNGLIDMIGEERALHEKNASNTLNEQLCKQLSTLAKQYQAKVDQHTSEQECIDLPAIYLLIKTIGEYPILHEQIKAVNKTHQLIIEQNKREAQVV